MVRDRLVGALRAIVRRLAPGTRKLARRARDAGTVLGHATAVELDLDPLPHPAHRRLPSDDGDDRRDPYQGGRPQPPPFVR